MEDLPGDPGLSSRMTDYNLNDQDRIQRAYLQKSLCQLAESKFLQTNISGRLRRLYPAWFVTYRSWLEYIVDKDTVYCLYCYLFKPPDEEWDRDSFTTEGFKNWKRSDKFEIHVGSLNSAHGRRLKNC